MSDLLTGIRYSRSLAAPTLNTPARSVLKKFDLRPVPPPAVNLAGSGDPNPFVSPQIIEVRQQSFVNRSFPRAAHIIGMHNETDQTVLLQDQIDLLLPQIDRIVVENVE